jgi:hypothetical protein
MEALGLAELGDWSLSDLTRNAGLFERFAGGHLGIGQPRLRPTLGNGPPPKPARGNEEHEQTAFGLDEGKRSDLL